MRFWYRWVTRALGTQYIFPAACASLHQSASTQYPRNPSSQNPTRSVSTLGKIMQAEETHSTSYGSTSPAFSLQTYLRENLFWGKSRANTVSRPNSALIGFGKFRAVS